jgi:perosamine synthetase
VDFIPNSRPSLGKEELQAVERVFSTGWLGMGETVREFEDAIAAFSGAKHVLCTNSGTSAIHLALDAIGVGKGDEVLVPAFTFVATIQAITATGARPVFCDICHDTLNISVDDVKSKITPRSRVILPVHYRGLPCDLGALSDLAVEHDLVVVEDAAHAFGSSYNGRRIGSIGDFTCFSFDPIKSITCGEGGAVAFNDPSMKELLMNKRELGIDGGSSGRYSQKRSFSYDVVTQGFRYHMSSINAAIGLVQLSRFQTLNRRKIEVAKRYDEAFSRYSCVTLPETNNYEGIGLFLYVMLFNENRDALVRFLSGRQIEAKVHYTPSHLFTYFSSPRTVLPVTENVFSRIVSLPLFAGITDEEIAHVIGSVDSFIRESGA